MKRLLSLLLVIAMLFSVCTVFTACDSTSVSDEDDGEKKKEEKKDKFQGLEIGLPKSFKKADSNEYSVSYSNGKYDAYITYSENEWEESAKSYWKDYKEQVEEALDDGEFAEGKADKTDKGTYYIYGIMADEPYAIAIAFYATDNSVWMVQIRNAEDNEAYDVKQMIKYITDWEYSDPEVEEEEEEEENEGNEGNEGDEGGNNIPQPPIANTNPEAEEVAGQVIYDNMGIVVKWVDMDDCGYYTSLRLYVENDSGYNIELYGTDFILNYSATFPADLFCFLGDGESSFYEIHLSESELALFGAEMVGSLDFTIEVIDSSDYQILDEGTQVSIKTEYDGYYNDIYSAGFVLFDENHVRVIVHEIQMDSLYDSFLWLYIENYSNQTVNVNIDDFYSMGWFLADASVYECVLPGTYTIAGVDLSELYNLGIEYPYQMENITGNVYCMDEEYNTLSSGEISYCPGDPDAFYNYEISGTTLYSGEGLEVILTDIVETEYSVEFTVYFYNSWTDDIRVNLDAAKINGHDTDSGMGIALRSGMRHMGTLRLWYDENCDFTCLEDLTSLFLDLEAHDNGYYELVHQQIEIPLN